MLSTFIIIFSFFYIFCHFQEESFREQQKKYSRVRIAYDEKYELLTNNLEAVGISKFNMEIFIRVFKQEQILEVWVRDKESPQFVFFKEFGICRISGMSGPNMRW